MRGGYRRGKAVKPVIIAGTPSIYLLRDEFLTGYAAGTMNGTASEPGPGIRQVTDMEALLAIIGDHLRGGGQVTATWGEEKIVWTDNTGAGFARANGRTLLVLFTPEEAVSWGDYVIGWASAVNITVPKTDGFGLHAMIAEAGGDIGVQRFVIPGLDLVPWSGAQKFNLRAMQYLLAITINASSTLIMLSTFGNDNKNARTYFSIPQYPLARLLWVDYADTTSPLFPSVQFYKGASAVQEPNYLGHVLESVRVQDLAEWAAADSMSAFTDHFTRANGAIGGGWTAVSGTWTVATGKAVQTADVWAGINPCIHASGLPTGDGVFQWFVTMPAVVTPDFYCIFRYQDINNFLCIRCLASRNGIYLTRRIAGAYTDISATGAGINFTAGTTFRITVYAEGASIRVFVDNVFKLQTAAGNFLAGQTLMGIGNFNNAKPGEAFDDVVAWPFQMTLPASITGKVPQVLTGGAILGQDAFTGVNGTLLSAHTPDVGPAWVQDNTNWTIQGNAASGVLPSALQIQSQVVQNLGVTDCECQVDIITPADAGINEYFSGIVKYSDSTHWIGARIVRSDSLQPNSHEIELLWCNGATQGVRHKVNLGNFYTPSTTYTLKCQWKGNLMHVFLDGAPVISYHMMAANGDPVTATKYGLHKYYLETGCTFDNWIVRAL